LPNSFQVFLRVLEYYSGVLILTTNRVGSFDEAIKSRVHCALYYPPLDEDQTLQVWKMNLDLLDAQNKSLDCKLRVRFNPEEIMEYARRHWKGGKDGNRWNGRQIKNAFQTAVALADWDNLKYSGGGGHPEGPMLERRHFEMVAKASDHFDIYLEKVRRKDHVRAKEAEVRRDDLTNEVNNGSTKKVTPKHKSTKGKTKSKAKPKSPEPSDDSSSESGSESASSAISSESTPDDAEPEEPPPPEPPKKKSSKKKNRKE
jgi:hypothetical protein